MRGPLRLEIKSPTDPTKKLPINIVVDVKRGEITYEYIKKLSNDMFRQGIHLGIILTDKTPHSELLERINSNIPQIVLVMVEHRDLVKLLTISLAIRRGVEIDSSLLSQTYKDLIDKFALKDHIEKWITKMANAGYLITCEGFLGRTAQACRFFINSTGRPMGIEEIWEYSWNLRNLLPFGIKSEIIPDMGIEELKEEVKVLKNYGFLTEENGKYHIRQHPVENRIIELLNCYGGMTTKSTLAKHFVLTDSTSRVFDFILQHMERKMLIQELHGNIYLMTLHDVKKLREKAIKDFEDHKKSINQTSSSFTNILTWKEREWRIISLTTMEHVIENLLKEIATANDEYIIRSRTFVVKELVDWYGHYVNKVISSSKQSNEIVANLNLEVNNVRKKFYEIFENIIKFTKTTHLQITLQELEEITSELEEVKKMPTSKEQLYTLENQIEQIAGRKKSRDPIRTDALRTDIDDVKEYWTVAEYLLVKKKIEHIQGRINDLNNAINSLNKSSQEVMNITKEFLKIFDEINVKEQQKLSSLLINISKRIAETVISRSLFPSNINVLTITELSQVVERHAVFLKNEIKRARSVKENVDSLSNVEKEFVKTLETIELLEGFYEKFWEENTPKNLIDERIKILNKYKQMLEFLQNEDITLDKFNDFDKIMDVCKAIEKELRELNKKFEKLREQYEELLKNVKRYLIIGSTFVKRFEENIVPKLRMSNENNIKALLKLLRELYDELLSWLEKTQGSILQGASYASPLPKTRTIILKDEQELKKALIREVKDLNEDEILILMKIIEFSAYERSAWLPLTEICTKIAHELNMPFDKVKQIILTISEKGIISLAVGF